MDARPEELIKSKYCLLFFYSSKNEHTGFLISQTSMVHQGQASIYTLLGTCLVRHTYLGLFVDGTCCRVQSSIYQLQGLTHARQALCHWAAFSVFFLLYVSKQDLIELPRLTLNSIACQGPALAWRGVLGKGCLGEAKQRTGSQIMGPTWWPMFCSRRLSGLPSLCSVLSGGLQIAFSLYVLLMPIL